jgi:hypothetical protein
MKIRKYLEANDLQKFQSVFEYAYECEHCLINYCEDGDKTNIEIYETHLDLMLDIQEEFEDDLELINLLKELLKLMQENDIDFIRY